VRELVRTNDPVLLSAIEALLEGTGIGCFVADRNMSVLDGSIGVLPRRILVPDDEFTRACRLLQDAGLGQELRADGS
jgi:hypothetical protein